MSLIGYQVQFSNGDEGKILDKFIWSHAENNLVYTDECYLILFDTGLIGSKLCYKVKGVYFNSKEDETKPK